MREGAGERAGDGRNVIAGDDYRPADHQTSSGKGQHDGHRPRAEHQETLEVHEQPSESRGPSVRAVREAECPVGPRATLGSPGAAAREVEPGDVIGSGLGLNRRAVVSVCEQIRRRGARSQREHIRASRDLEQVRRRGGRIDDDSVDAHIEDPDELGPAPSGPYAHEAAAQRMAGEVGGECLGRKRRNHRNAATVSESGVAHAARYPADGLQQLTVRDAPRPMFERRPVGRLP